MAITISRAITTTAIIITPAGTITAGLTHSNVSV